MEYSYFYLIKKFLAFQIEDDYNSLQKKSIQTENDLDNTQTQLQDVQAKYETTEKQIAEVRILLCQHFTTV